MLRKLGNIFIWLALGAWYLLITAMVADEAETILCNRIEVNMQDTINNRFVTPLEVREMVVSSGQHIQGYALDQINTRVLEEKLEENPYIRAAEVSKDISGRLEIGISQRVPLVRIMPGGKEGYYLDTEGKVMPLSREFSPLILLVSGHLPYPGMEQDYGMKEFVRFCTFLGGDEFWKEQLVQVYVDRNGEFELVPRVGAHQVLLGELAGWERKLRNLELLYEQGLSIYGWNNYRTINLKYTNQVICTKR